MKVEFLIARMDHTWDTEVIDIPDDDLKFERSDPDFLGDLNDWAMFNLAGKPGYDDVALIAVYCDNPEDMEE